MELEKWHELLASKKAVWGTFSPLENETTIQRWEFAPSEEGFWEYHEGDQTHLCDVVVFNNQDGDGVLVANSELGREIMRIRNLVMDPFVYVIENDHIRLEHDSMTRAQFTELTAAIGDLLISGSITQNQAVVAEAKAWTYFEGRRLKLFFKKEMSREVIEQMFCHAGIAMQIKNLLPNGTSKLRLFINGRYVKRSRSSQDYKQFKFA